MTLRRQKRTQTDNSNDDRREHDREWRTTVNKRLDDQNDAIDKLESRINFLFGALAVIVVIANVVLGTWVAVTISRIP